MRSPMFPSPVTARLNYLSECQSRDGGWGYLPGKHSWLEPTAYALLALHGSGAHPEAFERGWGLMRSWQLPQGAWKPAHNVEEPHWTTALCITLHAVRGIYDDSFHRGVSWLLGTRGAEASLGARVARYITPPIVDADPSLTGWPWLPNTTSWVEPTAHALFALKAAFDQDGRKELRSRIVLAERMLFERRCRDGGWNYGNRRVYKVDLLSYPETTALALLGLKGSDSAQLARSVEFASRMQRQVSSALAKAWLTIALQAKRHSGALGGHGNDARYRLNSAPGARVQPGSRMISRRSFIPIAVAGAACKRPVMGVGPPGVSRVAIIRAPSYSSDLVERMLRGAALCGLEVAGKRVLLKPNLVEFDRTSPINTDAAVIAAAIEVFERLGASEVVIGEGPGHRRDTQSLIEQAGYLSGIPNFDRRFVDLNRDDVSPISNFADLNRIYLPNTALGADLIVSLPKMKTHHWAGATLSMKNLFGLVPGAVYGWPKNKLHFIGIDRSVAELHRIFPRSFAIVDGIVGMDGNGPIQGNARASNLIVMGQDLVAVDATCCRLMGIDPEKIEYLRLASARGHVLESGIEQRGETVASTRMEYALMPEMSNLRLVL